MLYRITNALGVSVESAKDFNDLRLRIKYKYEEAGSTRFVDTWFSGDVPENLGKIEQPRNPYIAGLLCLYGERYRHKLVKTGWLKKAVMVIGQEDIGLRWNNLEFYRCCARLTQGIGWSIRIRERDRFRIDTAYRTAQRLGFGDTLDEFTWKLMETGLFIQEEVYLLDKGRKENSYISFSHPRVRNIFLGIRDIEIFKAKEAYLAGMAI